MGAPYPVFPVKLVGFEELHAAFLNESRTRRTFWDRVQEIRVSAWFWQMWDSTALDRQLSLLQRIPRSMIIYTLYSQRSICGNSHKEGSVEFRVDQPSKEAPQNVK